MYSQIHWSYLGPEISLSDINKGDDLLLNHPYQLSATIQVVDTSDKTSPSSLRRSATTSSRRCIKDTPEQCIQIRTQLHDTTTITNWIEEEKPEDSNNEEEGNDSDIIIINAAIMFTTQDEMNHDGTKLQFRGGPKNSRDKNGHLVSSIHLLQLTIK